MDAVVYDKIGKEAEKVREVLYGIYPQETITGANIAFFDDGADDIPVKALTIGVEPVQDLHGYDHPWPGGGGKNLLDASIANTETKSGVTMTVNKNATGAVTSIVFNGTATGNISFTIGSATLPAGRYVFSTFSGNVGTIDVFYVNYSGITNAGSSDTIETISEKKNTTATVTIASGNSIDNVLFYPMIRLATEADSTFEPYSNICPISGWTGAKIEQRGKNLFGTGFISGNIFINAETGYPNGASTTPEYRSTNYIDCSGWRGQVITQNHMPRGGQPGIAFYDDSKRFISGIMNSGGTQGRAASFTVPENASFMRTTTLVDYADDFQLEFGSTATAYEPYQGETYDITFPSQAGTVYGGTLDVTSGVLVVDRAMLMLNTANMNNSEQAPGWGNAGIRAIIGSGVNEELTGQLLNIGTKYSANTVNSNDILYLRPATYGKTQSEWQALAMDIQVCARLATPVTYQIAPQEIATLLGANNIWADTGAVKKLDYRADLGKYISSKITEASANILNA